MRNSSVLISGIGIAGPTLAYWLDAHGFRPTLIERSACLRTGGYIIDFWGLGFDVAERMGLLPDLKREGYDVQEVRFVDDRGRRVGGFGADAFRSLTDGRYVSLARSDLARLIYRKIEGRCETILGDSVSGIEQGSEGVTVSFERGPPRRFDLVVGADGLHSSVRKFVFGTQERFEKYLGYVVAAFEATGYRPRDERVYVSYSVPGKQLARFAMRGDRTLFLFVFATEATADPHNTKVQKEALFAEFGKAAWECPQILATLETCNDLYFDRVSQIRMDAWSHERVALVGDAAFCPSLLAGQGAALAMAAAYILAGELAAAGTAAHEAAFRRYEQKLRPLLLRKQKAAEYFAHSFAPKTRLGIFVRNQITKAFAIPGVAEFTIGRDLRDRIDLPNYPAH